jgi:hypothetical protein
MYELIILSGGIVIGVVFKDKIMSLVKRCTE